MPESFEIHADTIGKGKVSGEAMVFNQAFGFNNGVDPVTGLIVETGHPFEKQSVTGKVMVFPVGKGSAAGSYILYDLATRGNAPAAIVNTRSDTIIVIGCVMGRIPMLHRCDRDPVESIQTGDMLEIDLDEGVIKVLPKA
jgi:predicted aconitase with swiveling domain